MAQQRYKLRDLAEIIGGELKGDGETMITGVSGIKEAQTGDITFLAKDAYDEHLAQTKASAVITDPDRIVSHPSIRLKDPYLGFVKVLTIFAAELAPRYAKGVHAKAVVHRDAVVGDNVSIGPFCQIEQGARIGDNTTVLLGCYIGKDARIGSHCLIYPNVTIREQCEIGDRVIIHPGAVIGSDGFGFVWDGTAHIKIPQIGIVIIEDDVEIGANTTVDRATTAVTRICRGTKIDNLVQIAHNCIVGKNSILAGQVGLSGSTELGEGVIMAGQAGCVGHIKIGDGAIIAAQAGVSKSIPAGQTVSGYPAREHKHARRTYALVNRLPELFDRLKKLEAKLFDRARGGDRSATTDDN